MLMPNTKCSTGGWLQACPQEGGAQASGLTSSIQVGQASRAAVGQGRAQPRGLGYLGGV